MDNRPALILIDLDGTICEHSLDISKQHLGDLKLLPGVKDKFKEWDKKGCGIIIISGRRESTREFTEKQLSEAGLFYDKLILGVGGGTRVLLLNDLKQDNQNPTAIAINLTRNSGLENINI